MAAVPVADISDNGDGDDAAADIVVAVLQHRSIIIVCIANVQSAAGNHEQTVAALG